MISYTNSKIRRDRFMWLTQSSSNRTRARKRPQGGADESNRCWKTLASFTLVAKQMSLPDPRPRLGLSFKSFDIKMSLRFMIGCDYVISGFSSHTHSSCRYFQFDNTCLFSVLYLNCPIFLS